MSGSLLGLSTGYGGPPSGTSPITIQQKVVYTVFPITVEQRKGAEPNPKYGGDVDKEHMRILRTEPTVMEKSVARLMGAGGMSRESQLYVFSVLNGWGNAAKTKAELVRTVVFTGFAGNDSSAERTGMPSFLHGQFTLTPYVGPDDVLSGDSLYWDFPENDAEALQISKKIGTSKSLPLGMSRRTVILRKYDPRKQGMTRRAIRKTNDLPPNKLKTHAMAGVDAFYKAHVDIVDSLKKVFLLGMLARDAVMTPGSTKEDIITAVKQNADIERGARRLGLLMADGVTADNEAVHSAIISMLMPVSRGELMYDPAKASMDPKRRTRAYDRGEKILKHIQGGGILPNGLMEANVVEHLLASQAVGIDEITSRIVAKAISSGRPGDDIDVMTFVQ